MRKILKMIGISLAVIIGLIIIVVILFINFSPQFGRSPSKDQQIEYSKFENYKDGKFVNQNPTEMDLHYWDLMVELLKSSPNRRPAKNIPVEKIDPSAVGKLDSGVTRLTWLGHSSFLLEMQGKIILIDPMFSEKPTPNPLFGAQRYSKEMPIEIENLPFVDAVILSHDHYDHLDYPSIQKLNGKVDKYFAPLGVGNHLLEWGVEKERINQLNWWDSIEFDGIKFICTPARHFSGRALFDNAKTLWCSWVIKGKDNKIYFSGDSGYDTHFKKIGDEYGPFDIAMLDCGQYHKDWKLFHMMPEDAAQASIDLKSRLTLPIHWGAFTLAMHDWSDPIERITKKADELNLAVTTPMIGEPVILRNENFPNKKWWKDYERN